MIHEEDIIRVIPNRPCPLQEAYERTLRTLELPPKEPKQWHPVGRIQIIQHIVDTTRKS